jgi:hypothetical protein
MLRKYKNGQWEQFASGNSSKCCQGLSKGFHYPILTINVPVFYMGQYGVDPGWKKVGSGIRDKHPGSATLLIPVITLC